MEQWRENVYDYYSVATNGDWLRHHGILGQKWGKRNGPPYPLDAEDHSPKEKKAGWRKSLSRSGAGEYVKSAKQKVASVVKRAASGLQARKSSGSKSEPDSKNGEETSSKEKSKGVGKKVAVGVAVTAAVAVVGVIAIKNPKVRELAASGKQALTNVLAKNSKNHEWSFKDAVKESRQNAGKWDRDFERGWNDTMKAMEREQKQYAKAQKRAFKEEATRLKKEHEKIWKDQDRRARKEEIEKIKKEAKRRVDALLGRKSDDKEESLATLKVDSDGKVYAVINGKTVAVDTANLGEQFVKSLADFKIAA